MGTPGGRNPQLMVALTMSAFADAVVRVVAALRPGEIVSYGEVAAEAGAPGAARAVGRVLRDADGLPWWRVVTADGRLVPGLEAEHAGLLAAEGVTVRGNRIAGTRRRVRPSRSTDQEAKTVEPDRSATPEPDDRDAAERAMEDEERRAREDRLAGERNAAQRAADVGEQSIVMKPEGEAAATKRLTGDSDTEDAD